ncbi:MAG: hypothetical protein FWD90_04730 [Defluviitaleaceae bacterium]|nr:hypothetical protein [Defluviitaleaceae bacterium]
MAKTAADIGPIIRAIKQANHNIDSVRDAVYNTDQNVQALLDGIDNLTEAFNLFAESYALGTRRETASARLEEIKKELAAAYGAYGMVRKSAAEALRLLADGNADGANAIISSVKGTASAYWLTHSLCALGAWLEDRRDAAYASLETALHLDNDKTSMFLALACQVVNRKTAATQWLDRYLAHQDIDRLGNDVFTLLDAYRTDKLGEDTEGAITERLDGWIKIVPPRWHDRLILLRPSLPADAYPLLQKHSPHWLRLKNVMETAMLHRTFFDYLNQIFDQNDESNGLETVLAHLINAYDDAERTLYEQLLFEQRVIEYGGDEQRTRNSITRAKNHIPLARFLQGESALSVALGRTALADEYRDIVQGTLIPDKIAVDIGAFTCETDGTNEFPLLDHYYRAMENDKKAALRQVEPTVFERYGLYIGGFFGLVGLILLIVGNGFIGLFALIVCGAALANVFAGKKNLTKRLLTVERRYDLQREEGIPVLRGVLKEIREFTEQIENAQDDCERTIDFISGIQITPLKSPLGRKEKPKPAWDLLPPKN